MVPASPASWGNSSTRARRLADPEQWLEGVAFPEPADDPALAELEDEDLVLGADELAFDAEQWRAASERYAASERGSRRSRPLPREAAETARVRSKRTRALPRQPSSRRDRNSGRAGSRGPTRRIPRASAPISASVRTRAASSITARLQAAPPSPAAQPPGTRPTQPWGETVRRPSFRVSRGGLSKAQALALSWPELERGETAPPERPRPPFELLTLAALGLGLLLALGGPFLLRSRTQTPGASATSAAITSALPAAPTHDLPPLGADLAGDIERRVGLQPPRPAEAREASAPLVRLAQAPSQGAQFNRAAPGDPRAQGRSARERSRRLADEEALGAAGGARLRFGLACGRPGGRAFVPLHLDRLPHAAPARTLTWVLRHDPRLVVLDLVPGPAAREAGALLSFEAREPGRLHVSLSGARPLAAGELCVVRLSVPQDSPTTPLPQTLPLEARALCLDERAPHPAAGARGSLLLEH